MQARRTAAGESEGWEDFARSLSLAGEVFLRLSEDGQSIHLRADRGSISGEGQGAPNMSAIVFSNVGIFRRFP